MSGFAWVFHVAQGESREASADVAVLYLLPPLYAHYHRAA